MNLGQERTRHLDFDELELQPALAQAVRATFGRVVPEAVELLVGGLSGARLYRLTIAGRCYVLRHVLARGMTDPGRALVCQTLAAEQGVAPRLLYANLDSNVWISDFIQGPTLASFCDAGADPIPALGTLLWRLHSGPAFPGFISVPEACDRLARSLPAPAWGSSRWSEQLQRVQEMQTVIAPHLVERPCHYDLNPGNILVESATGRFWLIDWDAAASGDPYYDLADPGVFVPALYEQRARLLQVYFGRAASAPEHARYLLGRALALTVNALLFANLAHWRDRAGAGPNEDTQSSVGALERAAERCATEALALGRSAEYTEAIAVLR